MDLLPQYNYGGPSKLTPVEADDPKNWYIESSHYTRNMFDPSYNGQHRSPPPTYPHAMGQVEEKQQQQQQQDDDEQQQEQQQQHEDEQQKQQQHEDEQQQQQEQNSGSSNDDQPWSALLYSYSQATTLHGIRLITGNTPYALRRIIWFIVCTFSIIFYIYYLWDRVGLYMQFKTSVNVAVSYVDKVAFPAVTLCNQNTFRISAVTDKGWYPMLKRTLLTSSESLRACRSTEFRCHDNGTCVSNAYVCDLFSDCQDNSDEIYCDMCPMFRISSNHPAMADVHNMYFRKQLNTFNASILFVQTGEVDDAYYIYRHEDSWVISRGYLTPQPLATNKDTASSVQAIKAEWSVLTDSGYMPITEINFPCHVPLRESTIVLDNGNSSLISLQDLYDEASHQQDVFIQSCKWKGEECHADWIIPKVTDMGVCYMFNSSDMFIEQSGPGFGLTITTNIEYYEYTTSGESGVGVKLLLHDADDRPLMKELGTSISPGLYSYISVESTSVENQEPPWGDCGEVELDFYPNVNYSASLCLMDCYTKYSMEQCDCRHLNMPHKNGIPKACDVDTFLNCATEAFEWLQNNPDHCNNCPTPCKQNRYVPSTSFAIVIGDTTETDKTASLRKCLYNARETRYRVMDEHYQATLKVFHSLSDQFSELVRFALAVEDSMRADQAVVLDNVHLTMADCMMVHNVFTEVYQHLRTYVMKPMTDYRQVYFTKAWAVYKDLTPLLEAWRLDMMSTLQQIEDYHKEAIVHATLSHIIPKVSLGVEVPRGVDYSSLLSDSDFLEMPVSHFNTSLSAASYYNKSSLTVKFTMEYTADSVWDTMANRIGNNIEPLTLPLNLPWDIQQLGDPSTILHPVYTSTLPELYKPATEYAMSSLLDGYMTNLLPEVFWEDAWQRIQDDIVDYSRLNLQLKPIIPTTNLWTNPGGGANENDFPQNLYFRYPITKFLDDFTAVQHTISFVQGSHSQNFTIALVADFLWDKFTDFVMHANAVLNPSIKVPTDAMWAGLISFPATVTPPSTMPPTSIGNLTVPVAEQKYIVSNSSELAAEWIWYGLQELATCLTSTAETTAVSLLGLSGNYPNTSIPYADFSTFDLMSTGPMLWVPLSQLDINVTAFPELADVHILIHKDQLPLLTSFAVDFWSGDFYLAIPMSNIWSNHSVVFKNPALLRSSDPVFVIHVTEVWKAAPDHTKAFFYFMEDRLMIPLSHLTDATQDNINLTISDTPLYMFFDMDALLSASDYASVAYGGSALKLGVNPTNMAITATSYNPSSTAEMDQMFVLEYMTEWQLVTGHSPDVNETLLNLTLNYPTLVNTIDLSAIPSFLNTKLDALAGRAFPPIRSNIEGSVDTLLNSLNLTKIVPFADFEQNLNDYVSQQRQSMDWRVYICLKQVWTDFIDQLNTMETAGFEFTNLTDALEHTLADYVNDKITEYGDFHVYVDPLTLWDSTMANVNESLKRSNITFVNHLLWKDIAAPADSNLLASFLTLANSIPELAGSSFDAVSDIDVAPSTLDMFRLNVTMLAPLLSDIGGWCTWCLGTATPLNTLEKRLQNNLDSTTRQALLDAVANTVDIDDISNNYEDLLKEMWETKLKAVLGPLDDSAIVQAQFSSLVSVYESKAMNYQAVIEGLTSNLTQIVNELASSLQLIWDRMEASLEDVADMIEMVTKLEHYVWNKKCQVDLNQGSKEYTNTEKATLVTLQDIKDFVRSERTFVQNLKHDYQNENMTLDDMAQQIKVPNILSTIQGQKVRLVSILNDHLFTTDGLHEEINTINYLFLSSIDRAYLIDNSAYWNKYTMSNPGTLVPNMKYTHINHQFVAEGPFLLVPDGSAASSWAELAKHVTVFLENMEVQIDDLQDQLNMADIYFSGYLAGNMINQKFFSDNFLTVDLFLKELVLSSVTEEKAYELANLLSEVGGLMGLMLGASVITLAEIADLFIYNGIKKCIKNRKARKEMKGKAEKKKQEVEQMERQVDDMIQKKKEEQKMKSKKRQAEEGLETKEKKMPF